MPPGQTVLTLSEHEFANFSALPYKVRFTQSGSSRPPRLPHHFAGLNCLRAPSDLNLLLFISLQSGLSMVYL